MSGVLGQCEVERKADLSILRVEQNQTGRSEISLLRVQYVL